VRLYPTLLCALALPCGVVSAEELNSARTSRTPDGLFGFVDESSVIHQGVINPKFEFLPSWSPQSKTLEPKIILNYGVADNFKTGVAIGYSPTLSANNEATSQLTTISFPLQYVFQARTVNGTGIAILSQFFLGREIVVNGNNNNQLAFDNHIAIDHDWNRTYFAGVNLGYTAQNRFSANGQQTPSGTLYAKGSISMKINPHLYWGMQLQISQQLENFFSRPNGWASFVGTSVAIPISSKFSISAAYMRQMIGAEKDQPAARINNQNFSQNMGRVVIDYYF